jgi:hypothetical protein
MHFPANAGLIFLTYELTNYRYLVDTGASFLAAKTLAHLDPLSKGQMGHVSPLGVSFKKTV